MPTESEGRADREGVRREAVRIHEAAADGFARQYRDAGQSAYASAFGYGRKKIQEVLDGVLAAAPRGGLALDAGCGTGPQLAALARAGLRAVGVEPAAQMRRLARINCPGAQLLGASIFDLPFADATFDLVICIEVLRYFLPEDVQSACRELRRVLKPGGTLLATLVNRYAADGFPAYDRLARLLAALAGRRRTHCTLTTPGEAERGLVAAGFSSVETVGRLAGPLRALYRLDRRLGAAAARRLEALDDRVSSWPWTKPLAGHLIAIARA
jgi:SAM-dependent methyltransferase